MSEIKSADENNNEEVRIREVFNNVWSKILIADIQNPANENGRQFFKGLPKSVNNWLVHVLEKNATKGKQIRGLAVVHMFRHLKPTFTPEELKLACIVGWCCEIASCLMADDLLDGSKTRRGDPCWYTLPNVGLSAVNDAFMLENLMYQILRKYLGHLEHCYLDLVHLFQETAMNTIFGQSLDTRLPIDGNPEQYTRANFLAISKYKTGFYTFHCPVAAAMILAGMKSQVELIEPIMIKIGILFQAQDDYLDCYGESEITGKIGTDIVDGKCTWLMAKALELATEEQQTILHNSITKKDSSISAVDMENQVKIVYEELNLAQDFAKYEEKELKEIVVILNNNLPPNVSLRPFERLLKMIYKRNK